jgi:uroporphyrinogen III methyltransferase/synthase
MASFGDKNKHISLMNAIPGDFFTRELDGSLLDGEADIAVHSAKDLPYPLPCGLEIYCLTRAADQTDALVSRQNTGLYDLPAGARVGTSSATRRAELLRLRPDLTVVGIRGTIEERIAQVDNGYVDALIVATCALKRLQLEKRAAEVLPFKTHPLQGSIAVVGVENNPEMKFLFSAGDIRKGYGKVVLVGFGPGNPDLLTIAGDKALSRADIIFHDDLVDTSALEKYNAGKYYVGKRRGRHSYHQEHINELLYQAAVSGKNTVRLKGGDPMIFAHGREEIDYLKSRFVEVEVIPGISSGIAFASCTQIPLTHRGMASSVAFVTGHAEKEAQTPVGVDTLVYYMAGANLSQIARKLIGSGRPEETPVALVSNVSLPGQKICYTSLKELRHAVVRHPAPILAVVGPVVSFGKGADRQNVLVTGTTCADYAGRGNVVHTPLVSIRKNHDDRLYTMLKENIRSQQWMVFTSRYGVRFFFEILNEMQYDLRALANVKIATVGRTTTAELGKYNLYPDFESDTESAEGLIAHFEAIQLTGAKILLPRSDKGLNNLSRALAHLGNIITDAPVYTNRANANAEKVDTASFRKIIFASPSGVDAFKDLYGAIPENILLVARGKTTANKLIKELHETL